MFTKKFTTIVAILVVAVSLLSACAQPRNPVSAAPNPDLQETVSLGSKGTRNFSFVTTSNHLSEKQLFVTNKLSDAVNAGVYAITGVQTFYTHGILVAARVTYQPTRGQGNQLRVRLINSGQFWDKIGCIPFDALIPSTGACPTDDLDREITTAMNETIAIYSNVVKVNRVFIIDYRDNTRYLVAAEIWYLKK